MPSGLRILRVLLSLPVRIREAVEDRIRRSVCAAAASVRFSPRAQVHNPSGNLAAISIGERSLVEGQLLVFPDSGQIRVGEYCYIGEGARIWSALNVTIGSRVFIAHGVNVHDNNAHSLSADERHRHFRESLEAGAASFAENVEPAAVVIEDDAWIGFNASILKGVRIGRGAVVGACALVTEDVEPYAVVAGQPARVIGRSRP